MICALRFQSLRRIAALVVAGLYPVQPVTAQASQKREATKAACFETAMRLHKVADAALMAYGKLRGGPAATLVLAA